jgi:hypothetical protein
VPARKRRRWRDAAPLCQVRYKQYVLFVLSRYISFCILLKMFGAPKCSAFSEMLYTEVGLAACTSVARNAQSGSLFFLPHKSRCCIM